MSLKGKVILLLLLKISLWMDLILDLDHMIYIDFLIGILYKLCVLTVFCDALLGGYVIYVVLHVAYGRTYLEAAYDDGLLLSRGALGEVILGGVVELTGEGNVGMPQCHRVAYLDKHQCRIVLFLCFNYLYMYLNIYTIVFLT